MTVVLNHALGKPARESEFWNAHIETVPRAELDAWHLQRLTKLVHYAYERSPFYREKFDRAGLKPADIRSLEDFKRKVPLTDKSEFIDNVEYGGAAMFFGFAGETDICLFV